MPDRSLAGNEIRIPITNNNAVDDRLQRPSARQMDVQLKYAEDMITSPCSSEGHCYHFTRDLEIPLERGTAGTEVLTACYLEDGRLIAQGQITIRHLMEIAERRHPESQNNADPIPAPDQSKQPPHSPRTGSRRGSPRAGKWIELTDKDGKALHLSLTLKVQDGRTRPRAKQATTSLSVEEKTGERDASSIYHLSKLQAFEYLMDRVLDYEGCSKERLEMGDPALWLLEVFAKRFSIGEEYQHLLYLAWIFKTESESVTEYVLSVILEKFSLLCKSDAPASACNGLKFNISGPGQLDPSAATFRKVASHIEVLCGRVVENYFRLGDAFENGICEMNWCNAKIPCPPPALTPTVALLNLLAEMRQIQDLEAWYDDRLRRAALTKYRRIEESCRVEGWTIPTVCKEDSDGSEERENNKQDDRSSNAAAKQTPQSVYHDLKRICAALSHDLRKDVQIEESAVLPASLNLPCLTSSVYSQELKQQLLQSLDDAPPESPTAVVVDAFLAVGAFHEDLLLHLSPTDGQSAVYLEPLDIFSHFIDDWMHVSLDTLCKTSQAALTHRCLFEISAGDDVPILMKNLLQLVREEMALYQKLLGYWPCFGYRLERVVCDALRHLMAIISQECRMYRTQQDVSSSFSPFNRKDTPGNRQGMAFWEWQGVSDFATSSIRPSDTLLAPSQILLLHSLHRLMVEVPQFEDTLHQWTQALPERGDSEEVGRECGLFAQELRSQFTSAIVLTSQKLMHTLSVNCHMNFTTLLAQIDASYPEGATPSEVQTSAASHFDCLNQSLLEILPHLEERVFIALVRGLWDNVSRELFLFASDLREDHQNQAWKSRLHCSVMAEACNGAFGNLLTDRFPHSLTESDTIPPIHARKTQEMLDKNTKRVNNTFSVY